MRVFISTVVITSTLSWPLTSTEPSEGLPREPKIDSSVIDAFAGNLDESMTTVIPTATDSPEAGVPVWSSSLGPSGPPTVASIGIPIDPGTSSPAVVPSSAPSESLPPPAIPPTGTTSNAPPAGPASGPPISSFETQTTNPLVTYIPTSVHSSNSTQSSLSDAQESKDEGLSMPIGGFAVLMVLAGVLGVVFLALATLALRRMHKRKANTNPGQGGNVAAVAALEDNMTRRDDDLSNATTMASDEAQQQSEQNKMRLSVFPGWPRRLVQYAKGNGGGKRHVDFEMVTGGKGGR